MSKNLESRIERLESRSKNITIIYYLHHEETREQRKQRFKEENGYELPDNSIESPRVYRRLYFLRG